MTATRWEIAVDRWDGVRDTIRDVLAETARTPDAFITYSELVDRVGWFTGPDSHALAEMLGEISENTHPEVLLSALVVKADYSGPGMGFFRMAKRVGRLTDASNPAARDRFWIEEVRRCREHYGGS